MAKANDRLRGAQWPHYMMDIDRDRIYGAPLAIYRANSIRAAYDAGCRHFVLGVAGDFSFSNMHGVYVRGSGMADSRQTKIHFGGTAQGRVKFSAAQIMAYSKAEVFIDGWNAGAVFAKGSAHIFTDSLGAVGLWERARATVGDRPDICLHSADALVKQVSGNNPAKIREWYKAPGYRQTRVW